MAYSGLNLGIGSTFPKELSDQKKAKGLPVGPPAARWNRIPKLQVDDSGGVLQTRFKKKKNKTPGDHL